MNGFVWLVTHQPQIPLAVVAIVGGLLLLIRKLWFSQETLEPPGHQRPVSWLGWLWRRGRVRAPEEPPSDKPCKAEWLALPEPSYMENDRPLVRPLLLTRAPHLPVEPGLPEWVVAKCSVQNSYFYGKCDGKAGSKLTVRAVALRGSDHSLSGQRGQDVVGAAWDKRRSVLYLAVADGVGSLPDSEKVASDAVRQALDMCLSRPPMSNFNVFAPRIFGEISLTISDNKSLRRGATTLVVAEVSPTRRGANLRIFGVGDSEAWLFAEGAWLPLHHERAANEENATRHLPGHPSPLTRSVEVATGSVLVLASDGFASALAGRSALALELAHRWRKPPPVLEFLAHADFYDGYRADDRAVVATWIG